MDATTPQNVINLPRSEKERLHKSRNRVGHHIFLSRYFFDFKNLSSDKKIEVIYGPGGEPDNPYGDVDSVDTPPQERITVGDISRKAWAHYRELHPRMKAAWQKRASMLNKLPVPGKIEKIPEEIEDCGMLNLVKVSITDEWQRISKVLKNAVKKDSPAGLAMTTRFFGKEKVILGTQSYRSINMSPLVRCILFGDKFHKVREEIITETKNTVLLHFHSNVRIVHVLSIAGLCGVRVLERDVVKTCCGKVIFGLRRSKDQEATGFVMRTCRRRWVVKIQGSNQTINIRPPQVNKMTCRYDFKITDGNAIYFIKEYIPIRIKVSMLGEMKVTLNRVIFGSESKEILNSN